ncbi:hypothetical protein ABH922_001799 [Rhodococcus sp. 27YEA15]|uniref:hypothetical protein n=1 Tax=Rhodococcus sp. 27YEA15 TaxID=3156259 RepID=UPI003C7E5254
MANDERDRLRAERQAEQAEQRNAERDLAEFTQQKSAEQQQADQQRQQLAHAVGGLVTDTPLVGVPMMLAVWMRMRRTESGGTLAEEFATFRAKQARLTGLTATTVSVTTGALAGVPDDLHVWLGEAVMPTGESAHNAWGEHYEGG